MVGGIVFYEDHFLVNEELAGVSLAPKKLSPLNSPLLKKLEPLSNDSIFAL